MEISVSQHTWVLPVWGVILSSFFLAFLITYIAIPTIVRVARLKSLFDEPNGRTVHKTATPTLGGVAIFAGMMIAYSVFILPDPVCPFSLILASSLILFFTGIKDDILIIDPKKKLFAQILAAAIITILGGIRITSFHGFAGMNDLPYFLSILFTIFVIIVVINGFNLIDGINGLSSGVGILTASLFSLWFLAERQYGLAMLGLSLTGSLLAFFRFNVFSKGNTIFLGDTGSLFIGFMISILAIRFLETEYIPGSHIPLHAQPAVTFGILIIPLFDTLRVFILRIFGGESPFKPDRKHIHHRLIDLGLSHLQTSIIMLITNLFFVVLMFSLQKLGNIRLMIIMLSLASFLSYLPVFIINRRSRKIVKPEKARIVFKQPTKVPVLAGEHLEPQLKGSLEYFSKS